MKPTTTGEAQPPKAASHSRNGGADGRGAGHRPAPRRAPGALFMALGLRPLVLLSINLALLLAVGGIALQQLRYTHGGAIATIQRVEAEAAILVEVETGRRHFQTQLREWKEMLLAGGDPNAFATHRARFDTEERAVRARLKTLRTKMAAAGENLVDIDRLLSEYAALGAQYRIALTAFDPRGTDGARLVDQRVRGIDRAAAAAMEKLFSHLEETAKQRAAAEAAAAESRAAHFQRRLLLALAAAAVLTAGFSVALGRWHEDGRVPATASDPA